MVVQPGLIEGHQQWPLAVSAKKFCLIIPSKLKELDLCIEIP